MWLKDARLRVTATLLLTFLVFGCASQDRIAYSASDAKEAIPVGFDTFRFRSENLSDARFAASFQPKAPGGQKLSYLALSGGGGDGAYGAGILNGWTASGQRPTFTVVSGVSTGALIAPFAFLGPSYDPVLKKIYTDGTAASLVQSPNILSGLFGSGLFGNRRLLDLVSKYVTPEMVAEIGREHQAGRRLVVVTTDLDTQHGVVWNVGAIAASGSPEAVTLIREVIAASASVPLAFSPVLIDAHANGRTFQEMHVDGSVTTAIFILPLQLIASRDAHGLEGGDIYMLMNTSIIPKFSVVANKTIDITKASFETLSTQKTTETLLTTYNFTKANHIGFHLTAIDPAVDVDGQNSFDTGHMRMLYQIGYQTAQSGQFWQPAPPSLDRTADVAKR